MVLYFDFSMHEVVPHLILLVFVEGERKKNGGRMIFYLGRSEVGWGLGETSRQENGNE